MLRVALLFVSMNCSLAISTARAEPHAITNSEVMTLHTTDHEAFRIFVFKPDAPAPEHGYPVLYILDGNSIFGTVTDEVRRKLEDNYGDPAVVVAIGYPENMPWNPRREKDLTPWPPKNGPQLDPEGNDVIAPGEADAFLDFIESIVFPAVENNFNVDSNRRTLAGHSFGGLFTLHAFFTRTHLFQNYAAMSPSIWFADGRLFDEADEYLTQLGSTPYRARLLITVGGCEETPGECNSAQKSTPARDKWLFTVGRMVTNAKAMNAKLNPVRGDRVSLHIIEGEHHTSVIGASVARVVAFAMSSPTNADSDIAD